LEKITQAAKSILGGEAQRGSAPEKSDLDFLDPSMLKKAGFPHEQGKRDMTISVCCLKP
jgi:hypothetical protein